MRVSTSIALNGMFSCKHPKPPPKPTAPVLEKFMPIGSIAYNQSGDVYDVWYNEGDTAIRFLYTLASLVPNQRYGITIDVIDLVGPDAIQADWCDQFITFLHIGINYLEVTMPAYTDIYRFLDIGDDVSRDEGEGAYIKFRKPVITVL